MKDMKKKNVLRKIWNAFLHLVNMNRYDKLQESEISLAKAKELDTSDIEYPKFNWMQMKEIRLGLEKNLDVSTYEKKPDFTVEQMEEIRLGLEKNLDVNTYDDYIRQYKNNSREIQVVEEDHEIEI